MFLTTMT